MGLGYYNKDKTNIYNAIVMSTIKYWAEIGHSKAKTESKLHSTEIDFWRRSDGISRMNKIRNTLINKKLMYKILL